MKSNPIDPISLEVIYNATIQIVHELTINMAHTGYSIIIRELQDVTFAILDATGGVVAQYFVSPVHLGVIENQVREVIRVYQDNIHPGDCFLLNHPYRACQNHASDFVLISPIFYSDRLVGFVANAAHKPDIGGSTPGSNPSDGTDIFQAGLLIPALKLYNQGRLCHELEEIIKANSRTPDQTWGDTNAQALTNVYGVKKIVELMDKYGSDTVLGCWEEWARICEMEMRKKIAEIPDGTYGPVKGFMDDDGVDLNKTLWFTVAMKVKGDELEFIWDSIKQNRGPANLRPGLVKCVVEYCVKAALQPDLPNNNGCARPLTVIVPPEGHMLNPRYPAAVHLYAIECGRLSPTVMQLLALAVPEKVSAPSSGAVGNVILAGPDPRSGGWYTEYELLAGGYGARPTKDGVNCMDYDLINNLNTPIEAVESEFPIRMDCYELVPDSGGAGKYRGGLGIRRDWRMLSDGVLCNLRTDGFKFPAVGNFGAKPARPSRFFSNRGTERERSLPSKLRNYELNHDDTISWETGGGGGWGSPLDRHPEAVLADVLDGYVTIDAARDDYGVVIDLDGKRVDVEKTTKQRATLAK